MPDRRGHDSADDRLEINDTAEARMAHTSKPVAWVAVPNFDYQLEKPKEMLTQLATQRNLWGESANPRGRVH